MSINPEQPRFKGISLPPKGRVLALLLALYIFTGLIGHDPWKADDALSIGIVNDMLHSGNVLLLHLAGQIFPDAPLYYWFAALSARAFSWLLPLHDAIRLASGLFTLLALYFVLRAAHQLHGKEHAAAAPLILAGSVGFMFHAHEAQPMLAALSAHAAAYWALTLLPRRSTLAFLGLGLALAGAFLSSGVLAVCTLLPVVLVAPYLLSSPSNYARVIMPALLLALAICAAWLSLVHAQSPDYLAIFWRTQFTDFIAFKSLPLNALAYLKMLPWYTWPAFPLVVWVLWIRRHAWREVPVLFPLLAFLMVWLTLAASAKVSSAQALLLLPPLVLLAAPGVACLRRGAANAFDWFSMLTFSLVGLCIWFGWSAATLGWPERLAKQVVRLEPGFVGQFSWVHMLFACVVSVAWIWLILTSPRAPMRGIMHWMAGVTLAWCLLALLWLPWINYGKTYRPVAASLAAVWPQGECVSQLNLAPSVQASLAYFNGITLAPFDYEAPSCRWLLIHGTPLDYSQLAKAGWQQVWEGKRPSERREKDKLRLYQRNARNKRPLSEIDVDEPEDATRMP